LWPVFCCLGLFCLNGFHWPSLARIDGHLICWLFIGRCGEGRQVVLTDTRVGKGRLYHYVIAPWQLTKTSAHWA
jgi:hypothetical protein